MTVDVNIFPSIESRLEKVDKEIHSLLDEIKSHKVKSIKLVDLVSRIGSKVKCDIDTTKLIKSLRSKDINLLYR